MPPVRRIRLQEQRHSAVCDCRRYGVAVLIFAAKRARQTHRAEVVCEPPRKCHRLPRRRKCRQVFRVQGERAPVGKVDCEHRRAVYHFVFGVACHNGHRVVPRRRQPANLRRHRARKAARVVRADIAESDRAPVFRRQRFNFHIAHGAKVLAGDKQRARIVAAAAVFNAAWYKAEIRQAVSPQRANARRQSHRRSQRRSVVGDDGDCGDADGNKCQRAVPAHGNKCRRRCAVVVKRRRDGAAANNDIRRAGVAESRVGKTGRRQLQSQTVARRDIESKQQTYRRARNAHFAAAGDSAKSGVAHKHGKQRVRDSGRVCD